MNPQVPTSNFFWLGVGMRCVWAFILLATLTGLAAPETNLSHQQVAPSGSTALPTLRTALEVRQLSLDEAKQRYPVQLRVVALARDITREGDVEGVFQDATSPIFMTLNSPAAKSLKVGHLYAVAGATSAGNFTPNVWESSSVDLGIAQMPEPLHPSFEELVDGSLDCDWVELEGILRSSGPVGLQLLLKRGHVNLRIGDQRDFERVVQMTNAWVKLRGCIIPYRTSEGQVTGAGLLLVPSAEFVSVVKAAPADLFALPVSHIADLLRFDVRKKLLPWIKLSGQVSRVRGQTVFLLEGNDGARCLVVNTVGLEAGDQIEAVGLAEFGGSSPVLRDATIRKIGHGPLSPARVAIVEDILPFRREGTNIEQTVSFVRDDANVEIEGRLVNVRPADKEIILEMQSGLRLFQALIPDGGNTRQSIPPIGSELRLRGIVATWGQATAGQVSAFDLLLNSASDITVLQLPPRWTARDALLLAAGLFVAVALAALWIFQLRRRVKQSTKQLRVEMEERRQIENRVRALEMQTALETERIRIARNIHDELGARATKISSLATASLKESPAESGRHLREISNASQQLVRALDETVWTVNPSNDSLADLLDYITHFAEEFFRDTPIRCQLKIPVDVPEQPMSTELRHSLLAIVKESLNNVLKHSSAQNVIVSALFENGRLSLVIQDDGRGFSNDAATNGNGLPNLRARAAAVSATIQIESAPDKGTAVRVEAPLEDKAG